jgi:hypothetical protein
MHPKFYLMRADMEKYPLINSTLVTVTLSETSGLKERREYWELSELISSLLVSLLSFAMFHD